METRWGMALKNAIDDNFIIDDIEIIREFVIYQIRAYMKTQKDCII